MKTPTQIVLETLVLAELSGTDINENANGEVFVNAIHCPWCGTTSITLDDAKEHDGQCEQHPMYWRAVRAEALCGELAEALDRIRSGEAERHG